MAANTDADDEVELPEINTRDERELVELYDHLSDLKEENRIDAHVWDVEVTSPEGYLTHEQCEYLQTAVLNTIGQFRGIVGNDKYIPSGVYWSLVSEYAEEVIEVLEEDPEWADGDLDVFREIIMPSEMARFYHADPVAHFSVLYHGRHSAEGWLQHMEEDYYGRPDGFTEWVEDEGWDRALSSMAYAVCVKDVAQKVRDEGYDLDLEHLEYLD